MFKQFHTLPLCYATGFLKNVNGFLSEAIFGLYIFYEKMTRVDSGSENRDLVPNSEFFPKSFLFVPIFGTLVKF